MNWLTSFKIYTQKDVLIVMLMGFAAGLPLALSGSTLSFWLVENGTSMQAIGLFAALGTPYSLKFLWSPLIDSYRIPFLAERIGHRKAWLLVMQILLTITLLIMAFLNPKENLNLIAIVALFLAFFSATQDIVIDTYRVETLDKNAQAAGVAAYIAAYRVAMLISGAGFLFFVSYLERQQGFSLLASWQNSYSLMAILMVLCGIATLFASETNVSRETSRKNLAFGFFAAFKSGMKDILSEKNIFIILSFIVLFKLCDALAGALTAPFVFTLGFERTDYAAIVKGFGFAATIIGGFAGGAVYSKLSLYHSLWVAMILQMFSNLAFAALALIGKDYLALTFTIAIENFTGAIGSVIFVAYISSLCKNPLHTATQFALLSSLTAVARTWLAASAGFFQIQMGWFWFFNFTVLTALPACFLLYILQKSNKEAQ